MEKKKEEHAIVLDFLPNGYPFDKRPSHVKTPIVQAIGTTRFTLLELVPKKGIFLQPYEKVYIGGEVRDKIHHINGKIETEKLTQTARSELPHVIHQLVGENTLQFVSFFNTAQPLNMRMHSMELLPGVGKKHMWEVLDERKEGPFTSFEDVKKRVKLIPDPQKLVERRILDELLKDEKHRLFTERSSPTEK